MISFKYCDAVTFKYCDAVTLSSIIEESRIECIDGFFLLQLTLTACARMYGISRSTKSVSLSVRKNKVNEGE